MNNKTLKNIHAVFHTGSTYDCHFVIKELAEEFEGQFECLGENTEKYLTVLMPIKKELDNGKKSTYKIKFIDSFTFMFSSLSNVVDNLLTEFTILNVQVATLIVNIYQSKKMNY